MKFFQVGRYTLALMPRAEGFVAASIALRREGSAHDDKEARATAALRLRHGRYDILTRRELRDMVDNLKRKTHEQRRDTGGGDT